MGASITLTEALDQIWASARPRLEVSEEVSRKLSGRDLAFLNTIEQRFFTQEDAAPSEGQKSHSNLLAALQVARDHADGMAFLPPEERMKNMQQYADAVRVPVGSLIRLCAAWPEIERLIVSWED
nr:hypothetical protein [uncultured Shinella sp.]